MRLYLPPSVESTASVFFSVPKRLSDFTEGKTLQSGIIDYRPGGKLKDFLLIDEETDKCCGTLLIRS